jgi:hypothetical protein
MGKKNSAELPQFSINSKIVGIELGDFKVAKIDAKIISKLNKDNFAFEFNIAIKLEPVFKQIKLECVITIYSDITKKLYLGEIKSIGLFQIENYEEIAKLNAGGIPSAVFAMFAGVLISSTRGFLLLKSKDTFISGAIIPMINPNELFKAENISQKP